MLNVQKHIPPLGNYDVPTDWPLVPYKRPFGGTPGAPVMYEKATDPEDEGAGYGYSNAEGIEEKDVFFYHSDHLGSTSYITDRDGNATQFVCYKPYGEALVDEHAVSFESPWKFNGKELDAETGLYYYGARYYEPVLAMWYGVDALAEKYPSMGGYVYCAGNPVRFVDVDGNDWYEAEDGSGTIWKQGSEHIEGYKNIGTSYVQNIGDGIILEYEQNNLVAITEEVLDDSQWETQMRIDPSDKKVKKKCGDEGVCFNQSKKMVSKTNATPGSNIPANNITNTTEQIDYLSSQANQGHSVLIHVDYVDNGKGDGVGNHWIALSSVRTELNTNHKTFNFFDPGSVHRNKGTSPNNILTLSNNSLNGKSETTKATRTYQVTEVRRNE